MEERRLDTFAEWPVPFMSREDMASDGFIYTGLGDIVRCIFCDVCIGEFIEGDCIFADHIRLSSTYPFINGLDVGNIPIGEPMLRIRRNLFDEDIPPLQSVTPTLPPTASVKSTYALYVGVKWVGT